MTPWLQDFQSKSFRSSIGRASYHGPAFGVGFAAAFDLSQHARFGYGTVLDAQLREPGGDKGRRVVLPERQFGVHVQVTAELDGIHLS